MWSEISSNGEAERCISMSCRKRVRFHRHSQTADFCEWWHFRQLRPPRHRQNEWGVGGRSLVGHWSRRPDRSCMSPWTQMFRDSRSSRTTLSGNSLPKLFTSSCLHRSSGREKVWKFTPSFPSRDRSAQTAVWIRWRLMRRQSNSRPLVGPTSQDLRNQARKARVSPEPVIKMGVLLGCCPDGKQVFVTWACGVVPSDFSLRGSEMSLDMRLMAVSSETVGSGRSEHLAVGLSDPPVWNGAKVGHPQLCQHKTQSKIQYESK
jgi:hypothetical protein